MDAAFAPIIGLAQSQGNVKYGVVSGLTLYIVEILHTLPNEIALIWTAEWKLGKILFLLARYFIIIPGALSIWYQTASTIPVCRRSFAAGSIMVVVGVTISESILYLRVYALSGQSAYIGSFLAFAYVCIHAASFVVLGRFINSIGYVESPLPSLIGCIPAKADAFQLSIVFILILCSELLILTITGWIGFTKYRDSKSPFITIFYRDGLFYFVLLSAISAGNIICNLVAPPGYSYLLAIPQLALHSILSTRMVIHIREVSLQPGGTQPSTLHGTDIPLSTMQYAVRIEKQTLESFP